jgi:hypothetical protein
MKIRIIILLALVFIPFVTKVAAQNADFGISLGTFRIPNQQFFEKPRLGFNLNLGLYYPIHKHWSLGTNYNNSVIEYSRESVANTPLAPILGDLPIDGRVNSEHFSFLIQRNMLLPVWGLHLDLSTGVAVMVEANEFYDVGNFDEEMNYYTAYFWEQATSIEFQLPLRYAVYKPLGNRGSLGFEGGLFFGKGMFVRGVFFGPRLSIKI